LRVEASPASVSLGILGRRFGGLVFDDPYLAAQVSGIAADPAGITLDAAPRNVATNTSQWVFGPYARADVSGHFLHRSTLCTMETSTG
jgi:hypothetical protein